jgi:hypothetical protein
MAQAVSRRPLTTEARVRSQVKSMWDLWPIPVAVRSKAWVCGRSLARIVGSNPSGGMDVCVVLDVWTIAWNIRWHEGQKGLQQYKWIKGENPGINKKKSQVKSMWDLWWTKWHLDRFFSELSVLPCRFHSTGAPLIVKIGKKLLIHLSSSLGLHKKP